jgi:hypothetical protein
MSRNVTVQLPDEWADEVEDIADLNDSTQAATMRAIVEIGLTAREEYPHEFPILPTEYERANAPQLAKEGRLPHIS